METTVITPYTTNFLSHEHQLPSNKDPPQQAMKKSKLEPTNLHSPLQEPETGRTRGKSQEEGENNTTGLDDIENLQLEPNADTSSYLLDLLSGSTPHGPVVASSVHPPMASLAATVTATPYPVQMDNLDILMFPSFGTTPGKLTEPVSFAEAPSLPLNSDELFQFEDCYYLPTHRQGQVMEKFPPQKLSDFKHCIYNMLVDNYNDPTRATFVQPITVQEGDKFREGFRFNEKENPEKKLPELYAQHIRNARLDLQDQNSVLIKDLYKFYLRAAVELLGKYFEKKGKYKYLYEDVPLFIPGGSLKATEERIKSMKTRARKKRRFSI